MLALTLLADWTVLGFHQTSGGGNFVPLLLLVGGVGTAAWLVLSKLAWRNTVLLAAGAWVVLIGLMFGL